jgi:hypothetical protein
VGRFHSDTCPRTPPSEGSLNLSEGLKTKCGEISQFNLLVGPSWKYTALIDFSRDCNHFGLGFCARLALSPQFKMLRALRHRLQDAKNVIEFRSSDTACKTPCLNELGTRRAKPQTAILSVIGCSEPSCVGPKIVAGGEVIPSSRRTRPKIRVRSIRASRADSAAQIPALSRKRRAVSTQSM